MKFTEPQAKFNLGDTVVDEVTSYKGIIVARTLWLNGCYRYIVQSPKLNKDGVPHEAPTFDENQLQLVERRHAPGRHDTGGPRPRVTQPTVKR